MSTLAENFIKDFKGDGRYYLNNFSYLTNYYYFSIWKPFLVHIENTGKDKKGYYHDVKFLKEFYITFHEILNKRQ